jgi:hypothetical protein
LVQLDWYERRGLKVKGSDELVVQGREIRSWVMMTDAPVPQPARGIERGFDVGEGVGQEMQDQVIDPSDS